MVASMYDDDFVSIKEETYEEQLEKCRNELKSIKMEKWYNDIRRNIRIIEEEVSRLSKILKIEQISKIEESIDNLDQLLIKEVIEENVTTYFK